jgi:hypothetical protein
MSDAPKYGKMFAHVTPLEVEVYITDIAVSGQVFMKKRDFIKLCSLTSRLSFLVIYPKINVGQR